MTAHYGRETSEAVQQADRRRPRRGQHHHLAALVAAALRRIREPPPAAGTIEVTSPDLAQRAERVCAGHPRYVPGALATWTANVTDTLHDLVTETLPAAIGGFWFVDGNGRRLRPIPGS